MLSYIKRLLAVGSLALLAACGGGDDDRNVVQQLQADPRFSTLVTAVVAADLVTTLSGPGPFMVFAPTNDAFAKIPTADLNALLADKTALTNVLLYHVVPGKVTSNLVPADGTTPIDTALTGQTFTVNSSLQITSSSSGTSRITQVDVPATNGVIHVIDTVILPGTP